MRKDCVLFDAIEKDSHLFVAINSLGQIFRLRPESIIVVDSKSRRTFIPGIGGNIEICTDEGEFEVVGEPLATGPSTPTGSVFGSSSASSSHWRGVIAICHGH